MLTAKWRTCVTQIRTATKTASLQIFISERHLWNRTSDILIALGLLSNCRHTLSLVHCPSSFQVWGVAGNKIYKYLCINSSTHLPQDKMAAILAVGRGWGVSKVVATFNHVGGSFNLFMATTWDVRIIQSFSNLGLCAACWARFICHHELWPAAVSHPFSSLNSSLGFAWEKTLPENYYPYL